MKRANRFVSVLLGLVMIIGIVSMSMGNLLADTDDVTGLEFSVSGSFASVTGFTAPAGFDGALVIPETFGGASVTSIGSFALINKTNLLSITIPSGVTVLRGTMFYGCSNLTAINVAAANTKYSSIDGVVYSKNGATLICFPAGKTGNFTIPSGVTGIDSDAFYYCTGLTGISIPSTVTSIGSNAFSYCTGLTEISIPSGVTGIASYAFYHCADLRSISIPSTVSSIGDYAFSNCTSLTSISIPSGVTYIGIWAFAYCKSLTSISIPNKVMSIGIYSFSECDNLAAINVDAANAAYMSKDGVLYSKDGSTLIRCPQVKTGSFTIPSEVTSIGATAFSGCKSLIGITIPSSVRSIGAQAFSFCTGLTSISIPGSVTSIGERAFVCCDNLTAISVDAANILFSSINDVLYSKDGTTLICCPGGKSGTFTIPKSVKSIGIYAFTDCAALTSISVPGSVTDIGEHAFSDCICLSDVYFYGNAPRMGTYVFDGCASDITVHHLSNSTGFTNPWYGCPTDIFSINGISYRTHVQDVGWQDYVMNGETSGTSGQSKRLEAIQIKLEGISGGIEYRTQVQDIGWMDWVADDALSGTSGQSKRLEAIQIRLTGEAASVYDVYYRVHAQNTGWMDWAKNGQSSGTAGYSYRLEAIEVKLVPKGGAAPGPTTRPFIDLNAMEKVSYKTHVQDVGWQAYVSNGAESGTSGQSKRLEGIQIKLENVAGGIEYSTHIQDIGWQGFVANDAMSGTSGQSKRLEAIKIRLTGAAAEAYDIYYCVHAQNTGWLDWAKNGESSGTAGFGYRLEAIKVVLVPKGGPAPGATARAFVQG